jgi:hypothetical protein
MSSVFEIDGEMAYMNFGVQKQKDMETNSNGSRTLFAN